MSGLAALRREAASFGLSRTALRSLYRGARLLCGLRLLLAMQFTEQTLERSLLAPRRPYQCRFLSPQEILEFARDPHNLLPRRFVTRALAAGDECYAILDGGVLASFGWYARRPSPLLGELLVRFGERAVYMYHGYTKPTYRGQRLHGTGLARALLAYVERGIPRIVSVAEATNWSTRRSAFRVGFETAGWVVRVGFGRRAIVWSSPGCAAAGMRFERLGATDATTDETGA